ARSIALFTLTLTIGLLLITGLLALTTIGLALFTARLLTLLARIGLTLLATLALAALATLALLAVLALLTSLALPAFLCVVAWLFLLRPSIRPGLFAARSLLATSLAVLPALVGLPLCSLRIARLLAGVGLLIATLLIGRRSLITWTSSTSL